jgi:RNA polymerase subunit RPABC4/transcription elongation factor Spt4
VNLIAVTVIALTLMAIPTMADGNADTRSTVEFGPDLAVNAGDITLSKPVLLSGVAFNVSVKVYNLGDEDASSVSVDLLVDTESVDRIIFSTVVVDTWVEASFDLALYQGDHDIGILVDADDAIDEKREDNNDATLTVHVRGLPDASVDDGDVDVSNSHPEEGDVLTISALVRNLGESAATLVVVQFWDGIPGSGYLIANKTTSIPSAGQQLVTTQWDTSGLGGTHEINVVLFRVLPGEDILTNNAASTTVLVFTHWDLVIDSTTGDVTIDVERIQDGFVTVRDGATLTISESTFEFRQDYPNQFALFVEGGGNLVLDDAIVQSDQALLVILDDGTSLHVSSGSELRATVSSMGDVDITIIDSILEGGLSGNATMISLMGADVSGPVELGSGNLHVEGTSITSGGPLVLAGTQGVFVDCSLTGASMTSLSLFMGATAELRNVTCGGIEADDTSSAFVFRRVSVLVVDESSLVVPGSTIEIRHFINMTVIATATGGEDGRAVLEVLSDVIEGGESHFIGNYIIDATFSGETGSEPLLLTPFPAMDSSSNQPGAIVVLPPVEPRDVMPSSPGDRTIEVGDELSLIADFVQDGSIVIKGTLSVSSSTLTILQDRDHQFYVVVEGNGRLVLNGAMLTSNFPVNVYLYDNASLDMSLGSVLSINTLVVEEGATVSTNGASIEGRMLLRGGQIDLLGGTDVVADQVIIQAPLVTIAGGTMYVDDLYIDSPATAIQDLDLEADDVVIVASFANISASSMVMETLRVEGTILTITGTTMYAQEPLNLSVATFYMDTSSVNVPLGMVRSDSKVYLYDAEVPRPFSQGDATVLVYWYLTLTVQDVLGNPVAGATVDISYTNNETAVTSGVTNDDGEVRFPLLGSIVGPDGELFVGNYRIVTHNPKDVDDTVVRYVNLDRAKAMIASFPIPMVPPTMIGVDIEVANSTVIGGTDFNLTGSALAIFPTVRSALTQGDVTVQLWNNETTWSNTTNVGSDGTFRFEIPAPLIDGVYYVKAVVTPTGEYGGVADGVSSTLTIEVVPPTPSALFIILDRNRIDDFPAGTTLVIKGTVKINTAEGPPAPNVRVFILDPITKNSFQTPTDGLGVFEYSMQGPSFFGQYDYIVSAKDDELDVESLSDAKLVVIAIKVKDDKPEDDTNFLLIAIIAIVAGAAVVAGTLGYWAFSSKGRMVECGECGTLVPETANVCPKCGIEFEVEVAKCSVCESWIKSDATACPYCNTPFSDLEDISGGEEGGGGEAVVDEDIEVEVTDEEAVLDEPVLDNGEIEVPPEAIKKVPEGLKKEVRPRPIVTKKVAKEVMDSENGGGDGVAEAPIPRPRVKKVAPTTLSKDDEGLDDDNHLYVDGEDQEES